MSIIKSTHNYGGHIVKKRRIFVLAVLTVLTIILLMSNPSADEWIDLFILGRVPGTTVFLSFEFMFIAYVIVGMIIARVLGDVRNDYWRFRFFKLKALRTQITETVESPETIPATAGEVQPTV